VSKRTHREKHKPAKRQPGHGKRSPQRARPEQPDLIGDVAVALADDHPFELISLVSSLLAALQPRRVDPFGQPPDPDVPTLDELVRTFLDVDLVETSALLAVIAELAGDDIMRRRIRREIAQRAHALPRWLPGQHHRR
jgi:hypothetical protein